MPARCERSLVGKGSILVNLFYPESSPLRLLLKLKIFQSGRRDGATTLLAYAPITAPIPGAFISTIEIRKINRGRYGSELAFSFPKVAQGSGTVVIKSFEAMIDRRFTFKGERRGVASLSCPDGKVQIHADALLADGSHAGEEAVVPCSATR